MAAHFREWMQKHWSNCITSKHNCAQKKKHTQLLWTLGSAFWRSPIIVCVLICGTFVLKSGEITCLDIPFQNINMSKKFCNRKLCTPKPTSPTRLWFPSLTLFIILPSQSVYWSCLPLTYAQRSSKDSVLIVPQSDMTSAETYRFSEIAFDLSQAPFYHNTEPRAE